MTDGGFRPDGTFVSWLAHDTARLTEAFRRAVLRLFARRTLFDEDQAAGMLTWPHSGFHVHTAVWVPEDGRAFATRLARYCARNPVALERLTYDRTVKAVTYRSDKSEGPTAGTETVDPLEFLARVLVHIPDKGHVTTRYYGWYANRPRGMRRQAEPAPAPPAIVPAPRLAPAEASRRWAALLRQIFEVDPLACPACHGTMRIVACITQASVIDRILTHLRTRAATAAAGRQAPSDGGPPHALSIAPTPRGDVRRARWSHRGVTSVAAGHWSPPGPRSGGPASRASGAEVTPRPVDRPVRRCSRGRRSGGILDRPRNSYPAEGLCACARAASRSFHLLIGGRGSISTGTTGHGGA